MHLHFFWLLSLVVKAWPLKGDVAFVRFLEAVKAFLIHISGSPNFSSKSAHLKGIVRAAGPKAQIELPQLKFLPPSPPQSGQSHMYLCCSIHSRVRHKQRGGIDGGSRIVRRVRKRDLTYLPPSSSAKMKNKKVILCL